MTKSISSPMQNQPSLKRLTINLDDYTRFWEVNHFSFLWHDLFVYSVYKNFLIKGIMGFQEKKLLCICHKENYSFYLKKDELKKNKGRIIDFFISSRYDTLVESIGKILAENEQLPWKVQLNDWKGTFKYLSGKYTEASSYYFCTEAYYVDHIYDCLINSGFRKEELLEYSMPIKMATITREQLEWYNLILGKHGNSDIDRLIKEHFGRWKYIIASRDVNPYSIEKLHLRFNKDSKHIDAVKQAYREITNHFSNENIERIIAGSKYTFDGCNYILMERLREMSYLRFELRHVWMKTAYLLRTLLQGIFPKNDGVFGLSAYEILNDDFDGCNDRKSYIYYADGQKSLLFYNNTQKRVNFHDKDCQEEKNHISGKISFGTDVYGYAYVLDNNISLSDSSNCVNGDTILVLCQLCPEHVPLLSICKGIVVDEGGIAGHASIIAREMNKPAILGTINGTQRIRNNEYVYLDIGSNSVRRCCVQSG